MRPPNRFLIPLAAVAVGVLIAISWSSLFGQVDENSDTIKRLDHQDAVIRANVRRIDQLSRRLVEGRVAVVRIFCVAQNGERREIRRLIVAGAKSTLIFNDLFRQFGAPPYDARVASAKADAARLAALDCAELAQLARGHGSRIDASPGSQRRDR